ncbi:MAG: hypothetical protein M3Q56_11085 [Bacteroidota bacterium]|nr:hypothetical protein [Bacteroidota bacterium]
MKVIGQIPHDHLNITVFQMGTKYALKFEIGPFEQWFRFVESSKITGFKSIEHLINEGTLKKVFLIFDQMNALYKDLNNE